MKYKASNQIEHGCCYSASVVDTTHPHIIGGEHYKDSNGAYHYKMICECREFEDAEKIAKALNKMWRTT